MKPYAIFDIELIGTKTPVLLIGVKVVDSGKHQFFWLHKPKHLDKFEKLLSNYTWIGFNSENFDRPIIAAALMGHEASTLKLLATEIIENEMRSWQTYKEFDIPFVDYDHIDLYDVAPGVMLSLKTYGGRMGMKRMMDMPFSHTTDLTPKQIKECELYNSIDLDTTEELFKQLKTEMDLRIEMSAEYDIDMRSKSDAQIAEAILKNKCGLRNSDKIIPRFVTCTTPKLIQTDSLTINEVIALLDRHVFKLNHANGQPEVPDFLEEPIRINQGAYQMGVGGLHSTHDQNMYLEASDKLLLSDFDVASYYPNIMLKCGYIPKLGGGKGQIFIEVYSKIINERILAKRRMQDLSRQIAEIEECLNEQSNISPS